MSSGLPPISQALVPANVRAEGQKAVGLYETALSFEGMLDQQLTQSLTATLQPSSDGSDDSGDDSSSDPASSLMMQMLPGELSQALVSEGGLGLAPQLYQALGGKTALPADTHTTTPGGSAA